RITPKGYQNDGYKTPKLGQASTEEMVDQLDNPNMWRRINDQRLIVERHDPSVVETHQDAATYFESPFGRMHALWSLQGMEQLKPKFILKALEDTSPLVRKQAILLAESQLSNPEIRDKLTTLAEDTDAHVQFQLVLTISRFPDSE